MCVCVCACIYSPSPFCPACYNAQVLYRVLNEGEDPAVVMCVSVTQCSHSGVQGVRVCVLCLCVCCVH